MSSAAFGVARVRAFFRFLPILKMSFAELFKLVFFVLDVNYVPAVVDYVSRDLHLRLSFLCFSFASTTACRKSDSAYDAIARTSLSRQCDCQYGLSL